MMQATSMRRCLHMFLVALVALQVVCQSLAATLTVDPSAAPSAGVFLNISAAVTAADNGDEILVVPGVYTGAANRGIAITDAKSVSIVGGGASRSDVVLDCGRADRAFTFIGNDASRIGANWVKHLTLQNCSAPLGGTIYADGLSFNMDDVSILHSTATGVQFGVDGMGGAMYLRSTNSTFRNVLIDGVRHAFGGVAARGTDTSHYYNVVFRNMVGIEFGGCFLPEDSSASVMQDCLFEMCEAPFGGGVDTGSTSRSHFIRCIFQNNRAGRGAAVYHYGDSATTFDDCIIRNNIGTNSGGAMESGTNTAPVFRNTHFISNHAVGQGGVSRTSGQSTPRFENCYFFNNTSPRGGVASNGGLSSIQYTGCTFKSNVGLLLGGAIECQGEASVLIDGCVFEDNESFSGGGLYLDGPEPWTLRNTLFKGNRAVTGGGFDLQGSADVTLHNVSFVDNIASRDGGGMLIGFSARAAMYNGRFVGNSALSSGGGLAVVDQASVLVSQTSFVDNVASLDGGGVSLSAQLNITSSSFARNKATRSGGAFYMAHTTLGMCSKTWLSRLSFQSNQATRGGGGALFTTWSQLTGFNSARRLAATAVPALCIPGCHDCSFAGNVAAYGPAQATPSLQLTLGSSAVLGSTATPLVPFNATVVAEDYFHNVVSQQLGIRISTSLAATSAVACTLPTPPIAALHLGEAAFTSISVGGSPGTLCELVFTAEPMESGLPTPLQASVTMGACPIGYEARGAGADYHCLACGPGTYNVNGNGVCYTCAKGLLCLGGSTIEVAADQWAYENEDGVVEAFQCPPNFCCTEGGCPMEQPCANFREGFMCGKCSEGYAQVSGKCVPCSGTNYAFFAFVIVASLGFTVFNVWLDRKDPNPLLSQVTFFVQVAVLIIPLSEMRQTAGSVSALIDLDIGGVFELYESFAGDGSSDCIAQWSGLDLTAAFFAVPFLLFLSLGVVLLVHYSLHTSRKKVFLRGLQRRASNARRDLVAGASNAQVEKALEEAVHGVIYRSHFPWYKYTAAAVRLVLLSYSVVSDAALQLIMCTTLLGKLVMVSQPSVECWTGSHTVWGVAAWLLVVVWVMGLPISLVLFLNVVKQGSPLYSKHNRQQYGIMFDAYRESRYWFLAVGLARRSVAIVVYTLLFNAGLARQFALFVLILLFLMVHVHMKPFNSHLDNVAETGLLLILTLLSATMIAKEALPVTALTADSKYSYIPITQFLMAIVFAIWLVAAFGLMMTRQRRHKQAEIALKLREGQRLGCNDRLMRRVWCIRVDGRVETARAKLSDSARTARGDHIQHNPMNGSATPASKASRTSRGAASRGKPSRSPRADLVGVREAELATWQ